MEELDLITVNEMGYAIVKFLKAFARLGFLGLCCVVVVFQILVGFKTVYENVSKKVSSILLYIFISWILIMLSCVVLLFFLAGLKAIT